MHDIMLRGDCSDRNHKNCAVVIIIDTNAVGEY